jgi:hypothetical protein
MDFRQTKRRSVPFQGLKRRSRSNDPEPLEASHASAATTEGSAANATRVRSPIGSEDEAWSEESVWKICLAIRLVNSLLVQTYFNPDEHWQALEVAHRIAFG